MNTCLSVFLGKAVIVKSDSYEVKGQLLAFQNDAKDRHIPSLLVLENRNGKVILRGKWEMMATQKVVIA